MALLAKRSTVLQSIGSSQAALSRESTPVRDKLFPKASNQRKLELGKGAAENLIKAAQARARENQSTDSNN